MPRWLRVYGSTALGALVGCLIALLVLVPVIGWMRGRTEWEPELLTYAAVVVFALWFATIGARFGYKVGTYEEQQRRASAPTGSWSGQGWTLRIGRDAVDLSGDGNIQQFTGKEIGYLSVRRQGDTWLLETPAGIRPLPGLDEDGARAIQTALFDR